MQSQHVQGECQSCEIRDIVYGPQEVGRRSLKHLVRSYVGPSRSRKIEEYANTLRNWYARVRGMSTKPTVLFPPAGAQPLKQGDLVRVRSKEEIEGSLNHSRRLKGCSFPPEMVQYCNTIQRVVKPVKRFIDERDLKVRRTSGVVLLENVTCQGLASFGRCDRNCYLFWREEWLEKVDKSTE